MRAKSELKSLLTDLIDKYKLCFKLYKRILTLTEVQREKIVDEEFDQLEKITDQRQEVINRINQEQTELDSIRQKLADKLSIINNKEFINNLIKLDIPYKNKVESVSQQLINIISQIEELDQKNLVLLREQKDKGQKKLSQLTEGKKAFNSYLTNKSNREGKFIDNKR